MNHVIHIDATIGDGPGELSASWLRSQLPADGRPVELRIHSEGGTVFEAFAMLDLLTAYPGPVRAVVSSMALSAASLLLTACGEVEISGNGYLMIHDPYLDDPALTGSQRALLASLADRMVTLYAEKTRKPESTIRRMMAAETFLDAAESVRLGLADRVTDQLGKRLSAAPAVVARLKKAKAAGHTATARWHAAVLACGSVSEANRRNPGLRLAMLDEVNRR